MAVNKNGIVVLGAVFVDIKGFPEDIYVPDGRNAGHVEYIHGGVSRNVVEDIANLELRPTFLGIADNTALGEDVVRKLQRHKVNTEYMKEIPNGMGTWLAVFDHNGDLAGSISQRPNLMPILDILEENGDEIIENCDSIVAEIDMDKEIIKKLVQKFDCLICNQIEAGVFFSDDYSEKTPAEMEKILAERLKAANVPAMVVTMGGDGAVYAEADGESGFCPAQKVQVKDTTGAGDAFCAGVSAGLTYGKTLGKAVEIGTRLAASVITSSENVCPRFRPEEFGIEA